MAQRQQIRDFGASLFTGTGRVVAGSSLFDPSTTDFTACAWIKKGRLGSSGTIFSQADGTGTGRSWLQMSSTGNIQSLLGNVTHTGSISIDQTVWTHVAVTKTGTTINLYVNGVLDVTYTVTVEAASGVPKVGCDKNNATTFAGNICDVQVYQSLLSATAIQNLYAVGLQPSTPYLWYKLNDGFGTTTIDSGTGANNGTITVGTGTWSLDVPSKLRLPVRDYGTSMFNPQGTSFAYSASTDFNPAGSMTMGAWFKRAKMASGTYAIIGKGRFTAGATNATYSLALNSNHQPVLRLSKDGSTVTAVTGSMTVQDTNWHHIAVSYQNITDGTSIGTIYLDGQPIGQATNCPAPLFSSSADFGVSADFTGSGHAATGTPFSGFVDEAFFYNNILSQVQVKDIMRYGTQSSLVPMTDTNLYGFWTFDEGTGTTAKDSSSRGNNLTVNSATSWSPDVVMRPRLSVRDFGTSLQFKGSSNQVIEKALASVYGTTGYSVELWLKGYVVGSGNFIYFEGQSGSVNTKVGLRTSGAATATLGVFVRNDANTTLTSTNGNITVLDGKWHHVVLTDNNGTVALYVDGIVDSANFNYTPSGVFTINQTSVGAAWSTTVVSPFTGYIDQVRTYTTTLTALQVQQLYFNDNKPTSPYFEWKLDEGSGSTALDSSGNGRNGTLINSPTYSTDIPIKARSAATGRSSV